MRNTLQQAKNAELAAPIGICSTHALFIPLLNEAQQRIVMGPEKWWQMVQRYRIDVTGATITWPRHIATIESLSVSNIPINTRNGWFEFLDQGYGIRSCDGTTDWEAIDRGTAVTYSDVEPSGKKLKLYSDLSEAGGITMTVMGYNDSTNWIRHAITGADGEVIAVPTNPAVPVISTNYFSAITGIVFSGVRKGNVRLYELNVTAATQRQIGLYEPDEITPSYRRMFIGGMCDDTTRTIDAMVKLEFIPAANNNDFLMVANLPALKLMMFAIDSENKRDFAAAERYASECWAILTREAGHYLGTGSIVPLRIEGEIWNAGNIPTLY